MTFKKYLEEKYPIACSLQSEIALDTKMVEMLIAGTADAELVKQWMRNYGLFQGITTDARNRVADSFLEFAAARTQHGRLTESLVAEMYRDLFTCLYKTVPRSWMSATSKLLWCLYPHDIAIYDTFVHRTLAVLQCVDENLVGTERIGGAPQIKSLADIDNAVKAYMRYQDLVCKLLGAHKTTMDALRKQTDQTYKYDIRIMDKLLWMIGDPDNPY